MIQMEVVQKLSATELRTVCRVLGITPASVYHPLPVQRSIMISNIRVFIGAERLELL